MKREVLVLGGGFSGLAAGVSGSFPVFEATDRPGGICASYYLKLGDAERLARPPSDGEAFRFEFGGGHWIWGADALVKRYFQSFSAIRFYRRSAAVFLPSQGVFIPYPLQHNLRYLRPGLAKQCLSEIQEASQKPVEATTMSEWFEAYFGKTLCELFFHPFHRLYTSGLSELIAPQDPSKSPVNLELVTKGAFEEVPEVGYNNTFFYPVNGLDSLVRGLSHQCSVHYEKRVVAINIAERTVKFSDGEERPYDYLLSSIPLNNVLQLCGNPIPDQPDPYTSVLVLNMAATRTRNTPNYHWVYIPQSRGDFHRVGFYDNVDQHFLPVSMRDTGGFVSIYVEKALRGGQLMTSEQKERFVYDAVAQLNEWQWVGEVLATDLTFVDVAYTWPLPRSTWRGKALETLRSHNIIQIGRYGTWAVDLKEQGIVHSLVSGLLVGVLFREMRKVKLQNEQDH